MWSWLWLQALNIFSYPYALAHYLKDECSRFITADRHSCMNILSHIIVAIHLLILFRDWAVWQRNSLMSRVAPETKHTASKMTAVFVHSLSWLSSGIFRCCSTFNRILLLLCYTLSSVPIKQDGIMFFPIIISINFRHFVR